MVRSLLIRSTPSPDTPDFERGGFAGQMDMAIAQMQMPGLRGFPISRNRPVEPRRVVEKRMADWKHRIGILDRWVKQASQFHNRW